MARTSGRDDLTTQPGLVGRVAQSPSSISVQALDARPPQHMEGVVTVRGPVSRQPLFFAIMILRWATVRELSMEPHQELNVFLPELKAGLIKNGMSEAEADFVCLSVAKRARPRKITSVREYQDAWLICDTVENILTTLDDGSEAAAFCIALGQAVINYEDAYHAEFGHWPLNAATPEMTFGQTGSA